MKKMVVVGVVVCVLVLLCVGNAVAQSKDSRIKSFNTPQIQSKQLAVMDKALVESPDLIVSKFEICKRFDKDAVATFSVTFKNIGEGRSPCFDWSLTDSKGGVWVKSVCPQGSSGWFLQPGAEETITGTLRKSDVWSYPYKPGYISHVRIRVNKGSKEPKVNETTEVNNGSEEVDIYWDATGVANYQCTPFE
ncbi:MAG: hypothetical protein ABIA97_02900 [Candidatus Omnitrophota bacterium]